MIFDQGMRKPFFRKYDQEKNKVQTYKRPMTQGDTHRKTKEDTDLDLGKY